MTPKSAPNSSAKYDVLKKWNANILGRNPKQGVGEKTQVKKKARSLCVEEELEDRDLLIPPINHFFARVSPDYEADVAEFLKTHLSAAAIE